MLGKFVRALLVPVAIVVGIATFFLIMYVVSVKIGNGIHGAGPVLLVVSLAMAAAAATGLAVIRLGRLGRPSNPKPKHPGGDTVSDQPRPANPDPFNNMPQFPG
jgi:hypothetical protein